MHSLNYSGIANVTSPTLAGGGILTMEFSVLFRRSWVILVLLESRPRSFFGGGDFLSPELEAADQEGLL